MLNHFDGMGRIVRDIELRRTGTGTAVANFTIAVDRDFGSKDGGEKKTDFIDCVAWRNTAEFISKYFSKGRMIIVSGRLQIEKWEKDGKSGRKAEIVVANAYFADSKKDNEGGYSAPTGGTYDSTLAYAEQLAGKKDSFEYPYPAKVVDASDFAMLDDDDALLPF